MAPAEGPRDTEPHPAGALSHRVPRTQAGGVGEELVFVAQAQQGAAAECQEGVAAVLAAKALLALETAKAYPLGTQAMRAGGGGAQTLGDQTLTVRPLVQRAQPLGDLDALLDGQPFQFHDQVLKRLGVHRGPRRVGSRCTQSS